MGCQNGLCFRMDLAALNVVRLNAELFPVTNLETQQYARYGIRPRAVEVESAGELLEIVRDADAVMVVSQALPAEVIRHMQRCRVICRIGAGTDKIAIGAATEQGIVVANVPDFCVEEQADHAFALLLAVARRLNEMRRLMLAGRYHEGREHCRALRRLPGRTLGLIGFGGSARAMARRARGFGMQILATRRNMAAVDREAEQLGVRLVPLEMLLAESDYVSLHLPLSDETYHLLDQDALLRMKRGSVLINTSRGAIVDENALAEALRCGHLAGAGLDTFAVVDLHQRQSQPPRHPLFEFENVVFTPHVAAFSEDSSRELADGSVSNLVDVLSGRWPRRANVVNPEVQPRRPLRR